MARARSFWLLMLVLLAAAAVFEPAAADEGEERSETNGGGGGGDDGDDDDDSDSDEGDCGAGIGDRDGGAGIGDRDGDGPSLTDHGVIALAEAASDPRSLVLGWRQYGDCLIFERVVRRAKGFGRLHDVDVMVPRGNSTITHVLARPAGDVAGALRAERRGGGVGQAWVHLRLRAPRGFGLHYEVRVYGR